MKCWFRDGCKNPIPDLDSNSARVFEFFLACQNLWDRSDYSGQRRRIPRDELEAEARIRGFTLSEFSLEKIAAMERVLIDLDSEKLREQNAAQEHNNRG